MDHCVLVLISVQNLPCFDIDLGLLLCQQERLERELEIKRVREELLQQAKQRETQA